MRELLSFGLLLTFALTLAPTFAQAPTAELTAPATASSPAVVAPDTAMLDEVLVTGEQPGPGLWRVSKDGHTMWILGTLGPLPKKMIWRSRELESILAESQRVVRWVRIDTDLDVGFFAGLVALPYLFTAGNNPDGAKLKDVVPAAAYEQWLILKAKYVGRDNDIEELRPSFAAMELRSKATSAAGMSSSPIIWPAVERLAKKHKVKILEPEVTMQVTINKPRALIKKFRKTQLADVECFTQSLARLESDLDAMKLRANAWAIGKVDVLRKMTRPDSTTDCAQMLQQAILTGQLADELGAREMRDRMLRDLERTLKQQRETWLRTVDETMQANSSILALVPIEVLLDAQGPLQTLRERGYEVEEP